jgi:quinol monooxygenase YgiN
VIQFDIGRSRENPNVFALWEVYRDQQAIDAHLATEHFQRLVLNGVRPLALDRQIERVVPI